MNSAALSISNSGLGEEADQTMEVLADMMADGHMDAEELEDMGGRTQEIAGSMRSKGLELSEESMSACGKLVEDGSLDKEQAATIQALQQALQEQQEAATAGEQALLDKHKQQLLLEAQRMEKQMKKQAAGSMRKVSNTVGSMLPSPLTTIHLNRDYFVLRRERPNR